MTGRLRGVRRPRGACQRQRTGAPRPRVWPGVLIHVHDAARLEEFLRTPYRTLLLGVDTRTQPRVYALDARAARHQLSARPYADAVVSIPSAYELDDLTYGLLWAASNLDDCLLSDDAALIQNHRKLDTYQRLRSSEVTREVAGDLTHYSHAWLGSAFCARHILRNFGRLGDLPLFWTREQRGQEACTWLLFSHKLTYLRATSRYFGSTPMVRVFCVPERAVRDSPPFERILLFLAVASWRPTGYTSTFAPSRSTPTSTVSCWRPVARSSRPGYGRTACGTSTPLPSVPSSLASPRRPAMLPDTPLSPQPPRAVGWLHSPITLSSTFHG